MTVQSSQAAPLFPHTLLDVPAMHRSFKQHPFAHELMSQRAGTPPPAPPALLEDELLAPLDDDPLAPLEEEPLAPLDEEPPTPELLLADPLPELASPPLLASELPAPAPLASASKSLPSAHEASPTTTALIAARKQDRVFILAPPALRLC